VLQVIVWSVEQRENINRWETTTKLNRQMCSSWAVLCNENLKFRLFSGAFCFVNVHRLQNMYFLLVRRFLSWHPNTTWHEQIDFMLVSVFIPHLYPAENTPAMATMATKCDLLTPRVPRCRWPDNLPDLPVGRFLLSLAWYSTCYQYWKGKQGRSQLRMFIIQYMRNLLTTFFSRSGPSSGST